MNRSRSRFRPYRSTYASRSKGNQKAANQQRDATTVVIDCNYSFSCGQTFFKYKSNDGTVINQRQNELQDHDNNAYEQVNGITRLKKDYIDSGCAAINIFEVLRKSELYNVYSSMYDQFKIDNVKAKIIATNWVNNSKEGADESVSEYVGGKSYVIVTAWDRSGLNPDQIKMNIEYGSEEWLKGDYEALHNGIYHENGVEISTGYQNLKKRYFWTDIGRSITSYSSAMTKHLGPGNAYEIVRQLYPANLQEKEQYVSTKSLNQQYVRLTDYGYCYNLWRYVVPIEYINNTTQPLVSSKPDDYQQNELLDNMFPKGFNYDVDSPCNILQSNAIKFKPTLLVNVISGPTPNVVTVTENADTDGFLSVYEVGINKVKPVTFDIEFSITVTFRGTRYNKYI